MQYYDTDTNILNTEILNTYFNLKVVQTDYASIKENVLIRKYKFTNENTINLDLNFLVHSSLTSSPENRVSGMCRNDALNVVYQDKSIVFTQGQIYYGCLVQINQLLFDKSNRLTRSKLRYRGGRIKQ